MPSFIRSVAAAAAIAILAAQPAIAAPACLSASAVEAARVRQLDVMLMVGSLRCRGGADDYRAAYDRFLLRHRGALGQANQTVLSDLRVKVGTLAAFEALDKASVGMANHYGETAGFGCRDLAQVTAALADSGPEALPQAASMLIGQDVQVTACPVVVAVQAVQGGPATAARK